MSDDRRILAFTSLAEVMPEVDRLRSGHRTVGSWTLGQMCSHLAGAIVNSVEGDSFRFPWIVRKTAGPLFFRRILRTGRLPEGVKAPETLQPRAGVDAKLEAEALREAIRRFNAHPGPFADHPLAGPIDRESWERFHAIHCAHHLSFARPEAAEVG